MSVFFLVPLSHPYLTTGKAVVLTTSTFIGKVMSLLFNTLFTFVIAFFLRSNHLLISWLQSPSTVILETTKRKSVTAFTFSLYLPWSDLDAMVLCVLVTQLCPTLCNPMECSPPGSSVHGILQARILEWIGIPFSRASPQHRDRTWDSCIAGRFFIIWATREAHDLSFYNTEF